MEAKAKWRMEAQRELMALIWIIHIIMRAKITCTKSALIGRGQRTAEGSREGDLKIASE